jgi:hypothetical protein
MLFEDPHSSDDESIHLMVENLPKLEINPSASRGTKITIRPNASSQQSAMKSKAEPNTLRTSHNSNVKSIMIKKEQGHSRKTSENIHKSTFTIRTNPKTALVANQRARPSSKIAQKTTFEIVESQVITSDLQRAKKSRKTISIDIALKKSLFGENVAKAKAPGALRLASQFYGPSNLLEVRDKRNKELLSFAFLTRGHLVPLDN